MANPFAPHSFAGYSKQTDGTESARASDPWDRALGTLMAMPRFSNCEVPSGTRPPGTKELTGRLLPS